MFKAVRAKTYIYPSVLGILGSVLVMTASVMQGGQTLKGWLDTWSFLQLISVMSLACSVSGGVFTDKSALNAVMSGNTRFKVYAGTLLSSGGICLILYAVCLVIFLVFYACFPEKIPLGNGILIRFAAAVFITSAEIVVYNAFCFITKSAVGGVIIGYFAAFIPNILGLASDFIMKWFSSFGIRNVLTADDFFSNAGFVTLIYAAVGAVFFLLGYLGFRKSELK